MLQVATVLNESSFGSVYYLCRQRAYCFYMIFFSFFFLKKKSEFYSFWQCLLLNLTGNPILIFHLKLVWNVISMVDIGLEIFCAVSSAVL